MSMKKISKLCLILSIVCLISCDQQEYVKTQTGTDARKIDADYVTEMCYQGVVYVRFGPPQISWGSVKYTPNGKIVTCMVESINKPPSKQ